MSAATVVPSGTQGHSSSVHDVWRLAAVRIVWAGPAAGYQTEPLDAG